MPNNINDLNEQLDILEETKAQIKSAIISKGQEISAEDSFRSYATKIANINTVNNQDKIITENGVYTADNGYTGLGEVTVDVNTMPDFVFVQDEYPASTERGILLKKKGNLEWWENINKCLTDATIIGNTGYNRNITWEKAKYAILNSSSYTTEIQTELNNSAYIIILKDINQMTSASGYTHAPALIFGSDIYKDSIFTYDCIGMNNGKMFLFSGYGNNVSVSFISDYKNRNNGRSYVYMCNSYASNISFSNKDVYISGNIWISKTPEIIVEENPLITIIDGVDEYELNINESGTWVGQLDTSVGNATANDILSGKTAFVNNNKITGSMPNNGALTYTPTTSQQSIPAGYTSGGTIAGVDNTIDQNIIAENIKSGVSILGVEGSSTVVDTSDATATSEDILNVAGNRKTAYVNGVKVSGNVGLATSYSVIPQQGDESGVIVEDNYDEMNEMSDGSIPSESHPQYVDVVFKSKYDDNYRFAMEKGVYVGIQMGGDTVVNAIGLTADKLKSGETVLGVEGTFEGTISEEEYNEVDSILDDILGETNNSNEEENNETEEGGED